MKEIEIWGTIEFSKKVKVPNDCVTYNDVYDEIIYNLDVQKEDLGTVTDLNIVYEEPKEEEDD